jgi:hypothetical protein
MKVRFLNHARGGEWRKGEIAEVVHHWNDVYILEKDDGYHYWATSKEVEPWDQLSLFDDIPTA